MTPPITTGGDGTPYGPYYSPMIPHNPHIKYYEGDKRGYFKATVTLQRMELDLRFVTSVEDPNGTGYRAVIRGRGRETRSDAVLTGVGPYPSSVDG